MPSARRGRRSQRSAPYPEYPKAPLSTSPEIEAALGSIRSSPPVQPEDRRVTRRSLLIEGLPDDVMNIGSPQPSGQMLSEATVQALRPFRCTIPVLELTENNVVSSFPELSEAQQKFNIFELVVLRTKNHPYAYFHMVWEKFRGFAPDILEQCSADQANGPVMLSKCDTLIRGVLTFQEIRKAAVDANDGVLALLAAKRECDFRLLIAANDRYLPQIDYIDNWRQDFHEALEIMSRGYMRCDRHENQVANGESSTNGLPTGPHTLEPSLDSKGMQEARELVVSQCVVSLLGNDYVLEPSELKGVDRVKTVLNREVGWLRHYIQHTVPGEVSVQNVLLYGAEGTGKTAIVHSFAKWAGHTFFEVDFATVLDERVGRNEKFMAALFDEAKRRQPSIVFIDEIDGLLCSTAGTEQSYERKLLNCFKVQLSKIQHSRSTVMVFATTNSPWRLNNVAGLSRRFPNKLHVPLPDQSARAQLLQMVLGRLFVSHHLSQDDLERLASVASGMTGADIYSAVECLQKHRMTKVRSCNYFRPAIILNRQRYVPCEKGEEGYVLLDCDDAKSAYPIHYGELCFGELFTYLKTQERTVTPEVASLYEKYERGVPIKDELSATGRA